MREPGTEEAAIAAEIARIRSLPSEALRRRWQAVFGRKPPAVLSKDLLGRMIAHHLQEQTFGGLDRDSLTFLDSLARRGVREDIQAGRLVRLDMHEYKDGIMRLHAIYRTDTPPGTAGSWLTSSNSGIRARTRARVF